MPTIGYASLPIVPSLQGAKAKIESELSGVGQEAGERFGQQFSKGAQAALSALKATAQAVTLGITALGGATLTAGVNFNALEQKSRAALSTMLGSTQAASKQMDSLNRLVATSPFSKGVFIQAQQQLLGFGREASKVVPDLKAINDAVAATGGGNQQLQDLAFVMAQISAAGKISGQDLIQFGQRGINAAELIGKAMGKTGAQIKSSITAGTLDANTALDALTKGMEEQFSGASAAVKQTWDGVTQRISANVRNIGSMLAEPFISSAGGGAAIDWANKLGDIMVALRTKFQPIYDEIVQRIGPGLQGITRFLDSIRTKIQGWDTSNISGLVDKLSGLAPVLSAGSAAMLAFSGHMLSSVPIVGQLLGSINPLYAAIAAFVVASPELRDALGGALTEVASALAPIVPLVTNLVASLANGLVPIVKSAISAVGPLAEMVASALTPALQVLQPIIDAVAWTLGKIGDVIGVVLSPLQGLADAFTGNGSAAAKASKAWEDAQDNARGLMAGVGDLGTTLDENTAAFTKNTEAAISNYLAKHDLNNEDTSKSGKPSVLTQLQQWGVDTHAVVQGILGDSGQLKAATDQIKAAMSGTAQSDFENSGLTGQMKAAGITAQDLINSANGLPGATEKFKAYLDAQASAVTGTANIIENAHNAEVAQGQLNDLIAKVKTDTAGYGEVLSYVSKQQQAATDTQNADIQAKIAAGDIMGVLNGKLEVNAEQWGKLAPKLAETGESGEHLTARMGELGFVAGDATQALIDAANAALQVGASSDTGAGGIDNMTSALQTFLANAQQLRGSIANALTGFVDPVDAWSQTVQRVQQQAQDAMQSAKHAASGPNPAVVAADNAVKASERQKRAVTESTKDQLEAGQRARDAAIKNAKDIHDSIVDRSDADEQAAKDAQRHAQERVDAAKKEADELKKIADQQQKDAEDAQQKLDDAQFNLRAAEMAKAAARQGLSSAQTPEERASWQRVYADATKSERDAKRGAAQAQSDYDAKTQAATQSQKKSEQASKDQKRAEKELAAAKSHTADVTETADARQKAADKAYQDAKDAADARYKALQDQAESERDAAQKRYQQLLDAKDAAEQTSRQSTADYAGGVSQSISDMSKDVQPSFDDYLQTLRDQVKAQENWKDNIVTLAGKLPQDVALQLAQLGPKAAPMVQQLVDASDAQLQEWASLWPKSTKQGVDAMVDEIVKAIKPAQEQGALLGQAQIDAMTTAMQNAKTPQDLMNIINQFGVYMQQAADNNPITFYASVDLAQANQQMADAFGPGYNPATFWGQGPKFANAGPVVGPGTGTSDSIAAWLSNGEHVWSAKEVAGAGGQGAVAALRKMARDGALHLAGGGPVGRNEKISLPVGAPTYQYYDYSVTNYPVARSQAEDENIRLQRAANGWGYQ